MSRSLWLLLIGACLAAAGTTCPERVQAASALIACRAGADCDGKWTRARQWVKDNSKYPIRVDTATEISTVTRTRFHDPGLIVTVNKFRRSDGTFAITLRAGCGLFFGACKPSIAYAHESFARYVTFASKAPVPAPTSPESSAAPGAEPGRPKATDIAAAPQAVENPDDMLLFCRGGGPMMLHLAYPHIGGDRNGVLLEVSFERAAHGTRQAPLKPGECAFADRALRDNEPAMLSVSGPAGDLGVDIHLGSDGGLASYAITGTGGVHDVLGLVINGVLNKTDFSLHVSNVGTLRLTALVPQN
jgi:hypothetical protein